MREFTDEELGEVEFELQAWMTRHVDATASEIERAWARIEEMIRSHQECESRRTVQLGRMSATDLKCLRQRGGHGSTHSVSRSFGAVRMLAEWDGEFEE